MTEAEIRQWLSRRDIVPGMDVRGFVDGARTLGYDADSVLLRLFRAGEASLQPAVVAALRARGSDVFRPPAGGVGFSPTGSGPGSATPQALTYEQLSAPLSDRPNRTLFPPRAVFGGGFRTTYRQSRDRSRREARARAALEARAGGLDRDEVDELIDPIWAEHGLSRPAAHIRPLLLDRATGQRGRIDDLRATADIVQGCVKWGAGIVHLIRHHGGQRPDTSGDCQLPGMLLPHGSETVEVQLNPDARPLLVDLSDGRGFTSHLYATGFVELRATSDGSIEVSKASLLRRGTLGRLGVIPAADAGPFQAHLAEAASTGRPLRSDALRMAASDRTWRLYVYLPVGA